MADGNWLFRSQPEGDLIRHKVLIPVGLMIEIDRVAKQHNVSAIEVLRRWIKLGVVVEEAGGEITLHRESGDLRVKVWGE